MNLVLQIVGVTLAFAHIVLNILKKRVCWLVKIAALSVWVWLYIRLHLPIVAGLMAIYIILSVWGWIQWREK